MAFDFDYFVIDVFKSYDAAHLGNIVVKLVIVVFFLKRGVRNRLVIYSPLATLCTKVARANIRKKFEKNKLL